MRYLMLVRVDEAVDAADETGPELAGRWVREMDARGVRVLGDRLRPVRETTVVRVRDQNVLVSDGPYAETKEQLAGFDLLDCRDLQEAIEVASRHPGARDGVIEIRELWPLTYPE